MYVCMCVCAHAYVCMCVCVYTCMYVACMYVRMQVCTHVCVCKGMHACKHVGVHLLIYTHVCDRAAMVRVSLGVGRLGQGQPQ